MVSELILDPSDTNDQRTLRITDSSMYNPKIKVECGILEITAPGYLEPIKFNVAEGFSLVLNSSNMKMSKVKVYKQLNPLPDGIYTLKYSIKPNDSLWVEYDWLRINTAMKSYYNALCAVKLKPYPQSTEVKHELARIREAFSYLQAAKGEVQECGNRVRGMELYKYALELLKVGCKTC